MVGNLNESSVTFTEEGPAVGLDQGGDATVTDVDSSDFGGGNVTASIVANQVATEDVLQVGNAGSITVVGSDVRHAGTLIGTITSDGQNGNDLVVTLNVNATPARVQDLVRALQYRNTNTGDPDANARTVRVTVNDGDGGTSADSDVTVNVNAVNDAPVNTVPGAQTTDEDTALVFSAGNGNRISISDVDAGSNPVQVTLAASNGALTLNGTTGLSFSAGDGTGDANMTFAGTIANINAALNGMSFNPTPDYHGAASVQIQTNDQGNTGSGGPQTDTDTVNITVRLAADLSISKQADPATAVPGETITYTVVVSNAGPSDISRATLADNLPSELENPVWTCAGAACPAGSGSGDINQTLDLPAGSTITYTISGTVRAWATSLSNTAVITNPEVELYPANNSSTVNTPLTPKADLSISKSGERAGGTGTPITYTIVVRNLGPSDANGSTVTDNLPAEVLNPSWECVAAGGASCGAGSGTGDIDETVDLPAGGVVTYTVTGTADTDDPIANTARVAPPAGVIDPVTDNNQGASGGVGLMRYFLPIIMRDYAP